MNRPGMGSVLVVVSALGFGWIGPSLAQSGFPFDQELLLDAKPMRNSKRVPTLEVTADGQATIDLWCKSGSGQVVVAAQTITIIPGPMREQACAPERAQGDDDMLAGLTQVTTWRREGDVLVLIGPKVLRFRLATN
jgi:heat shock protein HslJ